MQSDKAIQLMTPLGSPKCMQKNMTDIQMIKASENIADIKSLIPITYKHIKNVYRQKFQNENAEDQNIIEQFSDPVLIDLVKDFMAYVMLYDEKEGFEPYLKVFKDLREEIKTLYRLLASRVLGKVHDFFKILIILSYLTFYFLVDMDFYDLGANHINFLIFCLEIVHYEINGINIQPNALKKLLVHKFQNNYGVPKVKKSLINIKVANSAFDKAILMRLSGQSRKGGKFIEEETFKINLESKVDRIKDAYRNMVDEFKEDMEKYKKSKDKSFELQHIKFRLMKQDKFRSQDKKGFYRMTKDKLNVNSMSQGLVNNTFNPKKQHFISDLIRSYTTGHRCFCWAKEQINY